MIRWHPAQRFGLDRAAVASVLSLLAVGCGAGTEIPTSPLDSPAAASDTGTVYGQVVAPVGQSAGRPQGGAARSAGALGLHGTGARPATSCRAPSTPG
jgi:hypothetical protein